MVLTGAALHFPKDAQELVVSLLGALLLPHCLPPLGLERRPGRLSLLRIIGREPRLSLTAVRVMLRPFVKVKHLLRRAALLSFGRLVYETGLAHIDALTDEQIKQEERRTM